MRVPAIGFVGTGHFASYLIAALRDGGFEGRILLSPYSLDKARKLADAYHCTVALSDANLLAETDWILLAVRPAQVASALSKLRLRPDQLLISAVAGVTVAELRNAIAVDVPIVRVMPSSYIESLRDGIIPLYPAADEVGSVLAAAGKIIVFDTEQQFELAMVGACFAGWMYRFMADLETWFVDNGLSENQARVVVAGNIAGAAAHAAARPDVALAQISDSIATEGTFTKAGLEHLLGTEAGKPWLEALDIVKLLCRPLACRGPTRPV